MTLRPQESAQGGEASLEPGGPEGGNALSPALSCVDPTGSLCCAEVVEAIGTPILLTCVVKCLTMFNLVYLILKRPHNFGPCVRI